MFSSTRPPWGSAMRRGIGSTACSIWRGRHLVQVPAVPNPDMPNPLPLTPTPPSYRGGVLLRAPRPRGAPLATRRAAGARERRGYGACTVRDASEPTESRKLAHARQARAHARATDRPRGGRFGGGVTLRRARPNLSRGHMFAMCLLASYVYTSRFLHSERSFVNITGGSHTGLGARHFREAETLSGPLVSPCCVTEQ